eukprot:4791879-Prymnesium_polylepis.2
MSPKTIGPAHSGERVSSVVSCAHRSLTWSARLLVKAATLSATALALEGRARLRLRGRLPHRR